jgi:hypothetical protein
MSREKITWGILHPIVSSRRQAANAHTTSSEYTVEATYRLASDTERMLVHSMTPDEAEAFAAELLKNAARVRELQYGQESGQGIRDAATHTFGSSATGVPEEGPEVLRRLLTLPDGLRGDDMRDGITWT